MQRQTYFARKDDIERQWHHVDADGQVLGRMASRIATVLMGKHRPEYTPHVDCGDFVVVTNAEKIVMTGNKLTQRVKTRYSGYPGGLRTRTYQYILEKHPERLVEDAVRRMLPKNRLGRKMYKKLKVYAGPEHPHTAQNPAPMNA
ncbi:MAG: 50S ribosomal protein L13 [Phycisphaerales bacterium]|nr:50S ribosomal protein L13 [Phycisphaerales bacterium]